MTRIGRSFGPGKIARVQRGSGPPQWVASWTDAHGKRHRQALSTDRTTAQRMLTAIVRARDLALTGMATEGGLYRELSELKTLYMADLASTACDRHVAMTQSRLDTLFTAIDAKLVRDVAPLAVLQYRARRLQEGLSVRTANHYVSTVRSMFAWCVRAGILASNPLANLAKLPEREASRRYRRRALSEEEIESFLEAAHIDDRRCAKFRTRVPQVPMWRTMLEGGPRYGELVSTTWSDLDEKKRVLTLRAETTKARRERAIPLRQDLVGLLLSLREVHVSILRRPLGPRDPIFLTPEGRPWPWNTVNAMRVFNRVLESAGIDRIDSAGRKLDIHALRHSAATRFARNGVPLAVTQRILGHSDPKLTARVYAHLEVEDLRSAVDQLHTPSQGATPRLSATGS